MLLSCLFVVLNGKMKGHNLALAHCRPGFRSRHHGNAGAKLLGQWETCALRLRGKFGTIGVKPDTVERCATEVVRKQLQTGPGPFAAEWTPVDARGSLAETLARARLAIGKDLKVGEYDDPQSGISAKAALDCARRQWESSNARRPRPSTTEFNRAADPTADAKLNLRSGRIVRKERSDLSRAGYPWVTPVISDPQTIPIRY